MIHIDIDADLNMVDDDRNFARPPSRVPLAIGDVGVAGRGSRGLVWAMRSPLR